jgi:hypothetical protein
MKPFGRPGLFPSHPKSPTGTCKWDAGRLPERPICSPALSDFQKLFFLFSNDFFLNAGFPVLDEIV